MSKKKKQKSKNKKISRKKILDIFYENPLKPLNYKQVSATLNANTAREREQVVNLLNQLVAQKELIEDSPGKYTLNRNIDEVTGVLDFTKNGSAYLISEQYEDDIFIPKEKTANALQGDFVKVRVIISKKKVQGQVLEVIERENTNFVGVFELSETGKFGFVVVNRKHIHVDIYVPQKHFNGAENGDKVVVQITHWEPNEDSPRGKITEVLGQAGEHEVEIHSIMADYGLPYHFPEEVEKEAADIDTQIYDEEIAKRRDFRDITTITIDPKDAKDFDDALSFKKLENGNIEIGVHIADVAHYVLPDTLLDKEAYRRATSVYLVDRVVPMLPEVLSNMVCSLRPNEEKLTFSAVFELDKDAQVKNQWFGRTVINSDRRFTYEEAQKIIEGFDGDFQEEIREMNRLAIILRKERLKNGAIAFDKLEVKFDLDEHGNPLGVYFKEGKEANHLIEEFMLLANKKVSEFVSKSKNLKTPTPRTFVYRIHDAPDPVKIADLKDFVGTLGYHIKIDTPKHIASSINELLKEVKGKGEENMVETLAMRSMSKAEYSTNNIGHYGLAFDYYSHFTSPIRRYPDVIAHRLLQHYLDGKKSPSKDLYEEQCEHSSERERMAADAERDSTKFMQVKYMQEHIGEVFDGVISGVTEWGIYVEANISKAEGLIRLRDLTDDHYVYDAKNHAIVGQRNREVYQLGDQVQIKLIKANLDNKTLDFQLV